MSVTNAYIADLFLRTADLLELQDDNPFRIRAYRQAAEIIKTLPQSIENMLEFEADLSELPHIGKDLANKITNIVNTGDFDVLEELENKVPAGLIELLQINGLDPWRISTLHKKLKIADVGDLCRAINSGKLNNLPDFNDITIQNISNALDKQTGDNSRKRHKSRK